MELRCKNGQVMRDGAVIGRVSTDDGKFIYIPYIKGTPRLVDADLKALLAAVRKQEEAHDAQAQAD